MEIPNEDINVNSGTPELRSAIRRRATIGTTPMNLSSDEGLDGGGAASADLWWRNKVSQGTTVESASL